MGGSRIVVEWARGPKVRPLNCDVKLSVFFFFNLQYDYRQDYERHRREREERGVL